MRAWSLQNYDERALSNIACAGFAELPPCEHLEFESLVDWVLSVRSLPQQVFEKSSRVFGNPPVTVYLERDFYIDVYFWLENAAAIHNHAFCGAFVNFTDPAFMEYTDLSLRIRFNECVSFGDLALQHLEVLRPREVRPFAHDPPSHSPSLAHRTPLRFDRSEKLSDSNRQLLPLLPTVHGHVQHIEWTRYLLH